MFRNSGKFLPMIICSCNLIRECEIRQAARAGAPSAESAYASLGYEPECGGCLDHASEIVAEERRQLIRIVPRAAA
jgi:bacterioferritin-associated ferredoxin